VRRAKDEIADREQGRKVIELAEELLIRRFSTYQREENRKMFKLANIRDTAVWKEAHEEGKVLAKQEMVRNCMANGLSLKQVAKLLKLPLKEVRRLAK
jgi:predicted transposase YdaD